MVNTDKLRGIIAERHYTIRSLSIALKMPESTLHDKMRKGVFNSDDMYAMIRVLDITDPVAVFFADEVA